MKLNKEAGKVSRQLFQCAFANGHLDTARVEAIVKKIVEEKPRYYLSILKAFQRLVRLEIEKHQALIESATPLPPEDSVKIVTDLQKKYGADLSIEFKTDPALIGGLRIKIGNDVWDDTVSSRLNRLQNNLSKV